MQLLLGCCEGLLYCYNAFKAIAYWPY